MPGLASIMIAVVFLYIVSAIFIIGGELNAAIRRYLARRACARISRLSPGRRQADAEVVSAMPAICTSVSCSPNSTQAITRRHGRHEVEQRRDLRHLALADHVHQQEDRADRQHQHQPGHGEDQFAVER